MTTIKVKNRGTLVPGNIGSTVCGTQVPGNISTHPMTSLSVNVFLLSHIEWMQALPFEIAGVEYCHWTLVSQYPFTHQTSVLARIGIFPKKGVIDIF